MVLYCRLPEEVRERISVDNLVRTITATRRHQQPQLVYTVAEFAETLESNRYEHLGYAGLEEDSPRLFQGLVGPPGRRAALFVFREVLEWLSHVTNIYFVDGTFDAVPYLEVQK